VKKKVGAAAQGGDIGLGDAMLLILSTVLLPVGVIGQEVVVRRLDGLVTGCDLLR
jgi:hypothetical protein